MPERMQDLLEPILDRQSQAWLTGSSPSIEELLEGSPLRHDPEAQLDVIYNEIVLREERGEQPTVDEYAHRYPHLRRELEQHLEVHRALGEEMLTQTTPLQGPETLPDAKAAQHGGLKQPPGYELLHLLGRGGMGVVYKARQRTLRRHVALKMFEPGRVPSSREIMRFRSEAEAIARLQHPNIVQIFEISEWNDLPFLALELAEGGTLAQRLQKLPFTPRAAAELVETLARAVHHAHENDIVHRDLKPANVLFAADGTPKVTDFGLAKILQDPDGDDTPRDATRTGEPIGTPRYMSPEQAAGQHELVSVSSDVYALGTLLYECLTGQVPFVAASVIETLQRIRHEEPLSPRRFQTTIPRDLETICLNCLHKEPSRRYLSALALAGDLRRFIDGKPITARPTPTWERGWKWCRRRPTHAALIAVSLLLMISGVAGAAIWERREQQRVATTRSEVEALMTEGQQALIRQDDDIAEAKFRDAWIKVQGEPALRDYQTGVAGWLDHSRRAANRQRWKQRVPPREYDELRDEAMFQSVLLDPRRPESVRAAREAVAAALQLTLPDDPAWRQERERLILLDADLLHFEAGAAPALARLEVTADFSSRLYHTRKASFLDQLGRKAEAARERERAERFPPDENTTRFLEGMDRIRKRDFAGAAVAFETILDVEPEHFTARLFQALCSLNQNRPSEARVGLTACIAQRPRFAWCYLFRGQCAEKLANPAAAKRDFERAAELRPLDPGR
ncbi:MAG: protein kinase [Planctomycetes bacterium]|nr:protein kinase [Planctomycetota bacterium]